MVKKQQLQNGNHVPVLKKPYRRLQNIISASVISIEPVCRTTQGEKYCNYSSHKKHPTIQSQSLKLHYVSVTGFICMMTTLMKSAMREALVFDHGYCSF